MAGIAIDSVDTMGLNAFAGVALTLIHILGAVEPREALQAVAGELVQPGLAGTVAARCHYTGIV